MGLSEKQTGLHGFVVNIYVLPSFRECETRTDDNPKLIIQLSILSLKVLFVQMEKI
jgi:hypothetical protein